MNLYAFDVDETLEVSDGPISMGALEALSRAGEVVGLCGNWAAVVQRVRGWTSIISFVGPMEMTKPAFLRQLRQYIPADEYVMVGNIKGVSGVSDDETAAREAGWRFIREADFAAGAR